MRHLIVLILGFVSCTHVPHVPPATGFFGTRELHTPVYCVEETNTPCAQVAQAIAILNSAADAPALRYAGNLTTLQAHKFHVCDNVIIISNADLPPEYTGMTVPGCFDDDKLLGTAIGLNMHEINAHHLDARRVIIHELLHALGVGHADEHTTIKSIMYPRYQHDVPTLTAADISCLQSRYHG